jgi:hypothetical protein
MSKKFLDGRWVFNASESIANLRVSTATFYRYRNFLNIEPMKKMGCRCKWYRVEDLVRILEAVYKPQGLFKLYTQLKKDGFYDE